MNIIVSGLNLILPFIAIRWFKKTKNTIVFLLWFLVFAGICFDVYNALYGWIASLWNQVGICLLIVVPLLMFYLGNFLFVFKTKTAKVLGVLLAVIGIVSYLAVEAMITLRV